ncbi:hypothetical protein GOBAR_AA33465 [Gossypium barbadense]|uniref:FAD-binding PCMH-type domain-containing protein n=1 Tax=Gossypium barbadense TaxID=3634 RepID=A0A2P5W800_GOSBA|nr:hypothetical protein GOBAR_AA33465 [Gossypium barbadense]
MKFLQFSMLLLPILLDALLSFSMGASTHQDFLQCLSLRSNDSTSISNVIYTRNNSSYSFVLESTIRNLRFNSTDTPKPLVIITPSRTSHFQATIYCARKHGLQIRTRSGGHDYEGLSYVARVPFVVVDLVNFRSVDVDVENRVAWVQAGAILGEVYYRIAEKSRTLGFAGGIYFTVGVGGHISGGGFGLLFRKYGLACDNVIDAQFIDVNGRILDRKSMGKDLFWAIRGGGGGSFGIVLAWKVALVPVPPTVTAFSISRTLEQNATQLILRWQDIAHQLPDEMNPDVTMFSFNSTQDGRKTILVSFSSLFLGTIDELLPIMQQRFPELGLSGQDCIEMSWIEAVLYYNQLQNQPLETLLNRTFRTPSGGQYYKIKSDYVKEPISETGLNGLFSRLSDEEASSAVIIFMAYGGIMGRIPEDATPYAHRADVENRVAWVQAGAILGEVYYRIAEKSRTLGFAGGIYFTVGVGGHISGGGFGLLFRKYGLACDNVIDAQFIDVNGRILDRKSMGKDLFWAIRGGGGGSFGIVLAWKVALVPVPPTVTAFSISRTLEQNATQLILRWQDIAHQLPDEMNPDVTMFSFNSTQDGRKTILVSFSSLFLGTIDELLPIMQQRFPELGLSGQDCIEMSWIEAVLYYNQLQNQPLETLLNRTFRTPSGGQYYKIKSDYVKEPISETGLNGLFSRLSDEEASSAVIIFMAYGGIMGRIPEDATPYAHRAGNLFKIYYNVNWQEQDNVNSQKYIDWSRRVYKDMTPFVSKSPREAYANYRDLDLGSNNVGITSYTQASIWGRKYFKNNFDRLVQVKTKIDPENFFKHEQSIPPLF